MALVLKFLKFPMWSEMRTITRVNVQYEQDEKTFYPRKKMQAVHVKQLQAHKGLSILVLPSKDNHVGLHLYL